MKEFPKGAYDKILFVLGMIQQFAELADLKFDELGLDLEAENLPKAYSYT